jgi:hypothetical protein
MSLIIYRPDGDLLSLKETLQYIVDKNLVSEAPDNLHVYGNFNNSRNGLINSIESIDFDLAGLEDALGLLVSYAISSMTTIDELKKLLAVYYKRATPSEAIQQRLTMQIARWAQSTSTDSAELKTFHTF